jgi:DNA-directed RNA polymerase subunit L
MEGKPIQRQGIQGLYTFTPFKLLRAQADRSYSMFLVPLSFLRETPELKWRTKSIKDHFSISVTERIKKKIVHPHEIYAQTFIKGEELSYIFKYPETEKWPSYPPVYLEYNWPTLSASYFCILGWVISSSQKRCPMIKNCPNLNVKPKTGNCRFYQGPIPYTSIYNVYPRLVRKFEDPVGLPLEPILAIRYHDKPLGVLRFTDQGNFIAFIDGVVFSPKLRWINVQPVVFLREGLGFRIANVHAIEIEFIPDVLKEFIKNLLSSNNEVARWMILKHMLFVGKVEEMRIREKKGFNAFIHLNEIVKQTLEEETSEETKKLLRKLHECKITSELVEFSSVLFLHSLAHVLKNVLQAKYGCGGEDISYQIEHPILSTIGVTSGKVRIIIFETAVGGYGYLKNFVEEIKTHGKAEMLESLLDTAKTGFRELCERKVERNINTIERELGIFRDKHKELVDLILKAFTHTFDDLRLYPHVNSVRSAIASIKTLSNEERSLMDDFLGKGPHCWDGCQLCVMLERECSFLPFDQPFLVSEKLLRISLDVLCSMLRDPVSFSPLKKGVKEEFDTFISASENKIDLVSPWISPEIVELLTEVQIKKKLKIRLITTEDPFNEAQVKSLKQIRSVCKRYDPNFQARIMDKLHAKGMLVDDIMVLHGSFNFTLAGLNANVENVITDFSITGVMKFKTEFEDLWKKASLIS